MWQVAGGRWQIKRLAPCHLHFVVGRWRDGAYTKAYIQKRIKEESSEVGARSFRKEEENESKIV
ncbi:MAG: hypothetical protein D6835_04155 [Candidatus Thermofonsia bacterium]|nr:MAG: hypothetical protein D6835_04155 [Candidatus Thermofonsia bacterium]